MARIVYADLDKPHRPMLYSDAHYLWQKGILKNQGRQAFRQGYLLDTFEYSPRGLTDDQVYLFEQKLRMAKRCGASLSERPRLHSVPRKG